MVNNIVINTCKGLNIVEQTFKLAAISNNYFKNAETESHRLNEFALSRMLLDEAGF